VRSLTDSYDQAVLDAYGGIFYASHLAQLAALQKPIVGCAGDKLANWTYEHIDVDGCGCGHGNSFGESQRALLLNHYKEEIIYKLHIRR
jgi:hypothetical protein